MSAFRPRYCAVDTASELGNTRFSLAQNYDRLATEEKRNLSGQLTVNLPPCSAASSTRMLFTFSTRQRLHDERQRPVRLANSVSTNIWRPGRCPIARPIPAAIGGRRSRWGGVCAPKSGPVPSWSCCRTCRAASPGRTLLVDGGLKLKCPHSGADNTGPCAGPLSTSAISRQTARQGIPTVEEERRHVPQAVLPWLLRVCRVAEGMA